MRHTEIMRKTARQIALFFPWSKKSKGQVYFCSFVGCPDKKLLNYLPLLDWWLPWKTSTFFFFLFQWRMSRCKQWAGAALTPTPVWEAHSGPIHPSHFLFLCYLRSPRISLHRRPYLPSHLINHAIELGNVSESSTSLLLFFLLPPSPVFPDSSYFLAFFGCSKVNSPHSHLHGYFWKLWFFYFLAIHPHANVVPGKRWAVRVFYFK